MKNISLAGSIIFLKIIYEISYLFFSGLNLILSQGIDKTSLSKNFGCLWLP